MCSDKKRGKGRLTARSAELRQQAANLKAPFPLVWAHLPLARALFLQMHICQQNVSRAALGPLEHIVFFYWIISCSGTLHSTGALGSWETFCRDKLTRSSGERVSLNVNLPPLLYLVVSSASLFLLTDHSNPQEMCSGTHFTGSLCLTVCGIMGITFAEVPYVFISMQRGLSWNKRSVSGGGEKRKRKEIRTRPKSTLKVTNQLRRQDSFVNVCLLFKHWKLLLEWSIQIEGMTSQWILNRTTGTKTRKFGRNRTI